MSDVMDVEIISNGYGIFLVGVEEAHDYRTRFSHWCCTH